MTTIESNSSYKTYQILSKALGWVARILLLALIAAATYSTSTFMGTQITQDVEGYSGFLVGAYTVSVVVSVVAGFIITDTFWECIGMLAIIAAAQWLLFVGGWMLTYGGPLTTPTGYMRIFADGTVRYPGYTEKRPWFTNNSIPISLKRAKTITATGSDIAQNTGTKLTIQATIEAVAQLKQGAALDSVMRHIIVDRHVSIENAETSLNDFTDQAIDKGVIDVWQKNHTAVTAKAVIKPPVPWIASIRVTSSSTSVQSD